MKRITVINEANKILQSLQKLQERCRKLLKKAEYDTPKWYPPHINEVLSTIEDLSNFDLEDAIVNAYDYED